MKIGIITAYNAYNFGAVLQAIALKKILQHMGHDVYFIKTYGELIAYKQFYKFFGNYILYNKCKNIKYLVNLFINFKKIRKNFHAIPVKKITYDTFDVVIIGSDELWNLETSIHLKEIYYGKNIPCSHILTYAISTGKTNSQVFQKYSQILNHIKKLDLILVRDTFTKNTIEKLVKTTCPKVVDPTLLLNVKNLSKEISFKINEKFLLIYGYYFNEKFKKFIINYARENHIKIIAVCIKHDWADETIVCHPLQFSDLIIKSELVITTTFHGTIFCILNHKQFLSIPTALKTIEILKDLGLENRCVDEKCTYIDFKKKLNQKIDFKISDDLIIYYRKESIKILQNYLQEIENEKNI